jgi:hypothetical protein
LETTGDYSADGENNDFPNATNYTQTNNYFSSSATNYGVFAAGQFTVPTMGTFGNETNHSFREPSFAETDISVYKDNHITERLNFQFRFDLFNVFNRGNFQGIQANVNAGNFGQVTSELLPFFWDVGGKFTF